MELINAVRKKEQRNINLIQFGEGNFLRGFADLMIDIANKKGVTDIGIAVVKPIPYGSLASFHEQEGMYTVLLQGKEDGTVSENTYVVESIQNYCCAISDYQEYAAYAKLPALRFVISNTTEAGIVLDEQDDISLCPPNTYPGKLTKFLYERFQAFDGDIHKGLVILPVELIESNGKKLKECVLSLCGLWSLPEEFKVWVHKANIFCSTLVDRIITGYPKDTANNLCERFGYEDKLIVTGETFGLWVIESEMPDLVQKEFPLDLAGMPVVFTTDQRPYRERKVRILNGAHTGTAMAAYLYGLDTVGECLADPIIRAYMNKLVYDEIAPTVPLPREDVKAFADTVMERFENPFIRHELMSIALNSVSKWKARILPSLVDSHKQNNKLPMCLTFSFAALLAFYTSEHLNEDGLVCSRVNGDYTVQDDRSVLSFFAMHSKKPTGEYVRLTAENVSLWGIDLSGLDGFCETVTGHLETLRNEGIRTALEYINRIGEDHHEADQDTSLG